jgi:hypothetical protein
VDEQPGEPGEEAAELEAAELDDGAAAADGRHLALVEVLEWDAGFALELAEDEAGDVAALLHGDGGEAGEGAEPPQGRRAVREVGLVAEDEHLGVVLEGAVGSTMTRRRGRGGRRGSC